MVLLRPETKITLQNSGDDLELLNPNGEIVHKVNYGKAPLNQSFNKTSTGWTWSETLTPGKTNIIASPETLPPESSQESTEEKQPKETLTAQIEKQLPRTSNSFMVFLIALIIAVSSGIIVLFLRKRTASEEK